MKLYWYGASLSLFAMICLLSCAPHQTQSISYTHFNTQNASLKSHKKLILLQDTSYQQSTSYTCGPAVIMTLLHHYGKLRASDLNTRTELRLAKEMGTTLNGTSLDNMVTWLEQHGFNVTSGFGISVDMLLDNLKKGVPTILIWNDWSGHSLLVVGYYAADPNSSKTDVMFMADPSTSSYVMTQQRTIRGMDSLSPDELEYNWFSARYLFNPSHTAVGMYIVAVPKHS